MKILMILSKIFITDPRVYKEAKSLVDEGHEVVVLVWDRKNSYPEEEVVDNIKVVRIRNKGLMKLMPNDLFRNPIWWKKAYKKGLELYRNGYKFDVVHCHDLDTLQAGVWLKKKLGIKLIYDAHEIFGYMIEKTLPRFISKLAFLLEKNLVKKVDHIFTVNEPLKLYFEKISTVPITVVMNCGDIIKNSYSSPKNDIFTICYFGVLSKSRMFPEIIDAVGIIENVRFLIAGRKEELYEEVKERCAMYDNVIFLGSLPYKETIQKTFECDALICMFNPKDKINQIGLPNKVFEALITGRPIIVTRGLYYSKIVEKEKCGIAVDYDLEEVKKAIVMLRDNPEICKKMGKNGLKAALREYNWKIQKNKLIKAYEGLN